MEPALHPLAARSVAAHLRKLAAEERAHIDEKGSESLWRAPVAASSESFGKGGPRA
ncbi:MAG: hypothetical protein M3N51_06335 [Actinomycetota bacterium]|nr:hypothetical protein [Actinomycetota bacterium]